MGAVQPVRANAAGGLAEIARIVDEVDVLRHALEAGQRIGNLPVQVSYPAKGAREVRPQRDLEGVVHGATDGEQHLVLAYIRVDAREGGARVWSQFVKHGWGPTQEALSRIQSVACIVHDRGACGDGAVDTRRPCWAVKTSVGCADGVQRGSGIQEARIPDVVAVEREQGVQPHIAYVIDLHNRSWAKLPLHSNIELEGVWGAVIRSIEVIARRVAPVGQDTPNKIGISGSACGLGRLLEPLLERGDLAGHLTDWFPAEARSIDLRWRIARKKQCA